MFIYCVKRLTTIRLADKKLDKLVFDFLQEIYKHMGVVAVVFTSRVQKGKLDNDGKLQKDELDVKLYERTL